MRQPELGELVTIRPAEQFKTKGSLSMVMRAPGVRLFNDGVETPWTSFLIERYRSGEIEIVPPPAAEEPGPSAPEALPADAPAASTTPAPEVQP